MPTPLLITPPVLTIDQLRTPSPIIHSQIPHAPIYAPQALSQDNEGMLLFDTGIPDAIVPDSDEMNIMRDTVERGLVHGLAGSYEGRFGKSIVIETDDFLAALQHTQRLLADPEVHTIVRPAYYAENFQMGFRPNGALVRRSDGENFTLINFRAIQSLYSTRRTVTLAGKVTARSELKKYHVEDLALLVEGALHAGIRVTNAGITHLNSAKIFAAGAPVSEMLVFNPLWDDVATVRNKDDGQIIRDRVLKAHRVHQRQLTDGANVSGDNRDTSVSELSESDSTENKNVDHIDHLYRPSRELKDYIAKHNIQSILELKTVTEVELTDLQKLQIQALETNDFAIKDMDALRAKLLRLQDRIFANSPQGNLASFDVETIQPMVALVGGSHNGQILTVQFSNHAINRDEVTHKEYLYSSKSAQEPDALQKLDVELASKILDAVGPRGVILVYNESFEKSRIREIAKRLHEVGEVELASQLDHLTYDGAFKSYLKELSEADDQTTYNRLVQLDGEETLLKDFIKKLREKNSPDDLELLSRLEKILEQDRFFDLLPLIRDNIYHPRFFGSFSLKETLGGLIEGMGYSDLDNVNNGAIATIVLQALLKPNTPDEQRQKFIESLLKYCHRDTLGPLLMLRKIFELAGLDWKLAKTLSPKVESLQT